MLDKEDVIEYILLEDKNKKYKIDNLIYLKKSDLLVILFSLNTKYYRKSYKFSVDQWYELIMSNEFYFDKCPEDRKQILFDICYDYNIKIINKYPDLRFYYYDYYFAEYDYIISKSPIDYLTNHIQSILLYIMSLSPKYINEIEEHLYVENILIYLDKDSWVKLINYNPNYYYNLCIELKGINYYNNYIAIELDWKSIIIKNIDFFDELLKYKDNLDEYDWLKILSQCILKLDINKIPEDILKSIESYQWVIIIAKNPKLLTNKKYNYYQKYIEKYSKYISFWDDLISYNDIFIKYLRKEDFSNLINNYKDFSKNLINKNLKYLKLIGLEKFLNTSEVIKNIYFLLEKNFKLLYKIPAKYIRKIYKDEKFINMFILHNIDIKNLGFYMKFKDQDEFIDELKKIDKKFKRNYEKLLKYLE